MGLCVCVVGVVGAACVGSLVCSSQHTPEESVCVCVVGGQCVSGGGDQLGQRIHSQVEMAFVM